MPYKDPEKAREYKRRRYQDDPAYRERALARARARYLKDPQKAIERTRQREDATRRWVRDRKMRIGCPCGENDPVCLDFHHRDPSTKSFTIGMNMNRSRTVLAKEMAKCEVLCANCHRKLEWTLK